jgi:hypothetical protein
MQTFHLAALAAERRLAKPFGAAVHLDFFLALFLVPLLVHELQLVQFLVILRRHTKPPRHLQKNNNDLS